MIIIEGPDGGGKTTLRERIQQDFGIELGPRASHSTNGPVPSLCKWVDHDLMEWGFSPLKIYDRYPLVSEPVYGTIVRGEVDEKFTSAWLRNRLNLMRSMSLVIWCLPPLDIVRGNINGPACEPQMMGVRDKIDAIWTLYSMHASMWTGAGMTYDYSHPNSSPRETQLANLIRRHIISWRHFS